MTRRLRSMLGRRSPSMRQAIGAVAVLLLLSVVGSALTALPRSDHHPARRPTVRASTPVSTGLRRSAPVVSSAELALALAAARFLKRYLPFVYRRASAGSVAPVTRGLSRELVRERAAVTPAGLRRHPRVGSLEAVEQGVGVVVATVLIEDGGITTYALRIGLREGRTGWVVSSVAGG